MGKRTNYIRDHSYITKAYIYAFVTPPSPCLSIVLVLKISKNSNFLTSSLPFTSAYVIYEWSLNVRNFTTIPSYGVYIMCCDYSVVGVVIHLSSGYYIVLVEACGK